MSELELSEVVAERMHDEWCQQHGADVVWRGSEMSPWDVQAWLAVADAAIAAIEWDNVIAPRAGLLVSVYTDGVIDWRVGEDDSNE